MAVGLQEQAWSQGVQEEALRWGVQEHSSAQAAAAAEPPPGGVQEVPWAGIPGTEEEGQLPWGQEKPQARAPRGRLPEGQIQWAVERRPPGGAGEQERAGGRWEERLGVEEEHPPLGEEPPSVAWPGEEEERQLPFGAGVVGPVLLEEQGLGLGGQQEQGLSLGGRQEQEGRARLGQEVGLRAQQHPQGEKDVSPGLRGVPGWGARQAVQHSALQEGGASRGVQEEGGLRQGVQEQWLVPEGLGWGVQEGAGNSGRHQPQQG